MSGALLTDADLSGADLTGADLAEARFEGVISDGRTTWPERFSPVERGNPTP